jgi:hypothetical protein
MTYTKKKISETHASGPLKSVPRPKKINMCLRSPDRPYSSAAEPIPFYRQLLDPNFYTEFG